MQTPADTYLNDDTYDQLARHLAKLIATGPELHGTDAQTEIATALGEIAGIWPQCVMDEAEFESRKLG